MLKLLKLLGWILFAIIGLGCLDQVMVRVPLQVTGVKQAQTFYVDFRGRLLRMTGLDGFANTSDKTIEQVIEKTRKTKSPVTAKPQRYLYVDDAGTLNFADSLEQVPSEYREKAQVLAE